MANGVLDLRLFLPEINATTEMDKLVESAAKIVLYNYEWRYVTLVLFNSTLFRGIENFLHIYNKNVILTNGSFESVLCRPVSQFVLLGTGVRDISRMLDWLKKCEFDNTGKHVIICKSASQDDCHEAEAIDTFWNYKIVNVIFVKNALETNKVVGYTYYEPKDCTSYQAVEVDSLDTFVVKPQDLFPLKFLNLHGCPLIASTFIQPPYMDIIDGKPVGADGDLILLIAEALNARLKMMTPFKGDGWGALEEDGTWSGSLGDVNDDLANISMTFASITLSRFMHFQMVYYNFVSIGWVTSPTEIEPSSLKLLYPFKMATHIAVVITFIFIIAFSLFTYSSMWRRLRRNIKISHPKNGLIFSSWTICMGVPIKRCPKKPALFYIVLFWIWYSFLIRTFYQTSLINSLKETRRRPNVGTIEEMMQADYLYGGGPALKDYFRDEPMIYRNWLNMNTTTIASSMYEASRGAKIGVAVNLQYASDFMRHKNGTLHVLPQRIVISPTVIYFKKYSPLAAPINRVLNRFIEAGLVSKVFDNHARSSPPARKEKSHEPINMEDYTGCYTILIFGWILASIIFVYESCVDKYKARFVTKVNYK